MVALETPPRHTQTSGEAVQFVVALVADEVSEPDSVVIGMAPHGAIDEDHRASIEAEMVIQPSIEIACLGHMRTASSSFGRFSSSGFSSRT